MNKDLEEVRVGHEDVGGKTAQRPGGRNTAGVNIQGTSQAGASGTRTWKRGAERKQEDRSCGALLALEGLWLLIP